MKNIDHLYKQSHALLKFIRLRRMLKPRKALCDEIFAHGSLVKYYASHNDETYRSHLNRYLDLEIEHMQKYKSRLGPEGQIDLVFLCLAAQRLEDAKRVCAVDVDYSESHKFAILLNGKLRQLLGIPVLQEEHGYTPLVSEAGLFNAFDRLENKKPVDFPLLKKYWEKTRSRRYEYTIFKYLDVFTLAFQYVESLPDSQH